MRNASPYMIPYQWISSGPSFSAMGFKGGYVRTREITQEVSRVRQGLGTSARRRARIVDRSPMTSLTKGQGFAPPRGARGWKISRVDGDVSDPGVTSGTVDSVAACKRSGGVRR